VSSNVGNRLARLAAHMVQQQSFYPLFPPPPEGQAQLDFRHAEHWRMPLTPDVLLLPSRLAPFAKDVMGSLCLNPGALTKATTGGTYALLTIHPIPEARLNAMAGGSGAEGSDTPIAHAVAPRTHVEILRI
jgi:DNA polymerase alpha subunit B